MNNLYPDLPAGPERAATYMAGPYNDRQEYLIRVRSKTSGQ
jgi:hypothetical protein